MEPDKLRFMEADEVTPWEAGMSWHDGERVTVAGGIIIAGFFLCVYTGLVLYYWDFSTLTTYENQPLATDFSNFWYASKLALSGKPAQVYDLSALQNIQDQVFGTHLPHGKSGYYYPPYFLFLILPLGLMPYAEAFLIYISLTLVLYLIVLSRISPHRILIPLCLLFPGIYQNFIFGQTGFISGILMGGGLLLLKRSPILAGCCFGLLTCRPPLAVLPLLCLLFGRYWKTLISALVTSLLLALLSMAIFGYETWLAYFKVMFIPMKLLETGRTPWEVAVTFFTATLSVGLGVKTAYLVQWVVMLVVLAGVAWVWRQPPIPRIHNAVLVLGTLVFSPYVLVYDLALLALPLCWLWEEGRINGRLPGELLLLLAGWLLPFAAPLLYKWINLPEGKLPLGPVILLVLFAFALLKARNAINKAAASQGLYELA